MHLVRYNYHVFAFCHLRQGFSSSSTRPVPQGSDCEYKCPACRSDKPRPSRSITYRPSSRFNGFLPILLRFADGSVEGRVDGSLYHHPSPGFVYAIIEKPVRLQPGCPGQPLCRSPIHACFCQSVIALSSESGATGYPSTFIDLLWKHPAPRRRREIHISPRAQEGLLPNSSSRKSQFSQFVPRLSIFMSKLYFNNTPPEGTE